MKVEDLIIGETYALMYNNSLWIIIYNGTNGTSVQHIGCISIDSRSEQQSYYFGKPNGWGGITQFLTGRLATSEEKAHLEACILADKYVPAPEVQPNEYVLI